MLKQNVRRPGIEPGSQEWESCMIPLHQRRSILTVSTRSYELSSLNILPQLWHQYIVSRSGSMSTFPPQWELNPGHLTWVGPQFSWESNVVKQSTVVALDRYKFLGTGLSGRADAKMWNASRFCVSSLRRGHAYLLCVVPIILVYVQANLHIDVLIVWKYIIM